MASEKKGNGYYRVLYINDSEESKAALDFMDSLEVAFEVVNVTGYKTRNPPPFLYLANGRSFVGLEQIKRFKGAYNKLWPSEDDEYKKRRYGQTGRPPEEALAGDW
jgi:hypothetical protein